MAAILFMPMAASIEESIEVAAAPARAWQLISTGEGLSSWFVTAEVVPGSSGRVTLRFGPGAEGTMSIQRWESPRRIRFGAAEGESGRAHDFELTARPAGGLMVRVVDCGLEEAATAGAHEAWAGYLQQVKAKAEKAEA